ITISLLKESGINYYKNDGDLWQLKNNELTKRKDFIEHAAQLMKKLTELDHDISIAELLDKYFSEEKYNAMKRSLQQYMEGYNAADINDASSLSLKEEWESTDEEQYRVKGGYQPLLEYIKNDSTQNGCTIYFNSVVKKMKWKDN